jgi:hypothetical protein
MMHKTILAFRRKRKRYTKEPFEMTKDGLLNRRTDEQMNVEGKSGCSARRVVTSVESCK